MAHQVVDHARPPDLSIVEMCCPNVEVMNEATRQCLSKLEKRSNLGAIWGDLHKLYVKDPNLPVIPPYRTQHFDPLNVYPIDFSL